MIARALCNWPPVPAQSHHPVALEGLYSDIISFLSFLFFRSFYLTGAIESIPIVDTMILLLLCSDHDR